MTDHDTPTPWPDNPWVLYSVDGHATPSVDRDDWLTEWRRRVGDIETAPLTPQQKRADLDRLLAANACAFRAVIQHGSVLAALDATEIVSAADMRLSKVYSA
jgi:hypothetical protein